MPKPKHMKPLNDKVPSYKQKLQFDTEFKKSVEREKIKPKEILISLLLSDAKKV